MNGGTAPSYRADIDCLRAVAVLAVIGFHWQVAGLGGGFVGVDIFFVISGFLITKLIADGMRDGSFSFANFYVRRARRLLPALYATILVSAIVGWFVLLPPAMLEFGRSAVAVLAFSSNVLFWLQAGYFDKPSAEKPLLHTWSLSVEEQFYLVLPVCLWLLIRSWQDRKAVVAVALAALAALSFALCCWQTVRAPSAAFFLSPGRAWEFLIGSGLVLLDGRSAPALWRWLALALGAAMIGIAAVAFGPTTPFPGPWALLPCLGAALIVWANGQQAGAGPAALLLAAGAFIGRLSYSLYLWHWPAYVFCRAWNDQDDLTGGAKAALFVAVFLLSLLSYVAIERPFRTRRLLAANGAFVAVCAGTAAAFAVLVAVAPRYPFLTGHFGAEAARIAAYGVRYPYAALFREGRCFLKPEQSLADYDQAACFDIDPRRENVLLWGDSQAAHLLPGLSAWSARKDLHLLQATASICPPLFGVAIATRPHCRAFNDRIAQLLQQHPDIVVLLSAEWPHYEEILGTDEVVRALQATAKRLGELGIRFVVIGPSIHWRQSLPGMLAHRAERKLDLDDTSMLIVASSFLIDRRLRAALPGLPYISILDTVCPDQRCPAFVGDVPMAFDMNHLTKEASLMVIDAVAPQLERALKIP
jgi:peptidoglycan/LPS O-acetylase OafA/YrhL